MAILNLFFLFLSAFCSTAVAQQPLNNTIALNSSLTPTGNSSWLSPSGLYAFGFYQIGNGYAVGIFLAGVPDKAVVWTANRNSTIVSANVALLLTGGGLILRQAQSQDLNITNVSESISSASMQDSGNFVLYNSTNGITWQSFDHPTDTLLPGQSLADSPADDLQLFSSFSETDPSTGPFRLLMQQDGAVAVYPAEAPNTIEYGCWNSKGFGTGPLYTLNLNNKGHMYVMRDNTNIIENLTNGDYPDERTIYRAKIDVDGIFRLYSYSFLHGGDWTIKFNTSNNKCDPEGICGFNAFVTNQDTGIECQCLPGFDFISPGNNRSGCERNFSVDGCKSPNQSSKFVMKRLEKTEWVNDTYEMVKTSTREECEQACLNDCSCQVAQLKDGECRKERLPLRYGKISLDSSNVALVKVPISPTEGGTRKKKLRLDILIISVCLLVSSLVILAIFGILVYTKKLSQVSRDTIIRPEYLRDVAPRAFTYAELEQATNNFEEELGRGAFGTVYKGKLQNFQKLLAVKRLERLPTAEEGEREFQNEMTVIGKTHHRNLVRLLGYCLDKGKRLLVYEYMSNGSLADIIFVPDKQPSWDERVRIACDIARGILYLHEECETQIIHCDIKPQNILMDEHFCAKISDFGLAKLLKHDQTKTFTAIRGTKGYVAPEWHRKLPVTVKADVYSFGIMLLEIICLRRCVDWSLPEDEAIIEEWAYNCYEAKELHKLVANDEVVDMRGLERMIKIAIWCSQGESSLRPSMKKVLLLLEGTADIPIPPNPTSFLSTT